MSEQQPKQAFQDSSNLPNPTFQLIAAQFASQAMIEMGEIPNPLTGEKEVSLPRAKFTIDLLQILKDKSEGNLTPEELQFLEGALYDVRLKFVEHKGEQP